jgi:mannosyltransferase
LREAGRDGYDRFVSRTTRLALSLIVALAAALSVELAHALPFSFDEAFSWRISQFGWRELVARLARDNHSPFYYGLLKLWTGLFGTSLMAMRAPSVIFETGAVLATFFLARAATEGPRRDQAGLIAAALLAVLPRAVLSGVQARMYGLTLLLVALSSLALLRALRPDGTARHWALYGALAAAMAYSQYICFFLVVAAALFVLADALVQRRFPLAAMVAPAVFVLLWLPWVRTLIAQHANAQTSWWAPKLTWEWTLRAFFVIILPRVAEERVGNAVVLFVDVAALAALALLARAGNRRERLILTLATVPFLCVALVSRSGANVLIPRYLVFLQLLLAVCAAALVVRTRYSSLLATGMVLFLLACFAVERREMRHNEPAYAQVIAHLAAAKPSDVVVIDSYDYFAMRYFGSSPAWRVYGADGTVDYFNGGGLLDAQDHVLDRRAVEGLAGPAWIVENSGGSGTRRVATPAGLRALGHKEFGLLTVTEYAR